MILITEESFVQKISLQVVDLPVEIFLDIQLRGIFFSMNQPKAGKNVTIQKVVAQWLLCVLQNALFFRRSGYFVVFLSSPCWEDNLGTLLTERGCSRNLMHPGGTFHVSLDLLRKIYISKLA